MNTRACTGLCTKSQRVIYTTSSENCHQTASTYILTVPLPILKLDCKTSQNNEKHP